MDCTNGLSITKRLFLCFWRKNECFKSFCFFGCCLIWLVPFTYKTVMSRTELFLQRIIVFFQLLKLLLMTSYCSKPEICMTPCIYLACSVGKLLALPILPLAFGVIHFHFSNSLPYKMAMRRDSTEYSESCYFMVESGDCEFGEYVWDLGISLAG